MSSAHLEHEGDGIGILLPRVFLLFLSIGLSPDVGTPIIAFTVSKCSPTDTGGPALPSSRGKTHPQALATEFQIVRDDEDCTALGSQPPKQPCPPIACRRGRVHSSARRTRAPAFVATRRHRQALLLPPESVADDGRPTPRAQAATGYERRPPTRRRARQAECHLRRPHPRRTAGSADILEHHRRDAHPLLREAVVPSTDTAPRARRSKTAERSAERGLARPVESRRVHRPPPHAVPCRPHGGRASHRSRGRGARCEQRGSPQVSEAKGRSATTVDATVARAVLATAGWYLIEAADAQPHPRDLAGIE